MENITFINVVDVNNETSEHALIEHADGSFTSMTKAHYEAQQVEHLTEIPPQAALSTPNV